MKSVHLFPGNRSSAMLALCTQHGRETPRGSGNWRQVQPPATSGPNIAHSTPQPSHWGEQVMAHHSFVMSVFLRRRKYNLILQTELFNLDLTDSGAVLNLPSGLDYHYQDPVYYFCVQSQEDGEFLHQGVGSHVQVVNHYSCCQRYHCLSRSR